MDRSKIIFGKWEATAVLINALSTQVILNFPRSMAELGGTAGWMIPIYISILALLGFTLIQRLYSKFEGMDLLDIGEYAGGNIGRIIIGICLLAHFIFAISVILREFSEDMKIISLTTTPISFVTLFFTAAMVIGSYLGIEAIVRFHAFVFPIIIFTFLIIIVGIAPYYDITDIFPILGLGPFNIFGKGFFRVSSFSGLVILFMIIPFIKTHKNFKSVGYWGIGISSFFLFISTFVYLITYRFGVATESFLPIFQMARLISYGRFFQRIESIFVLAWAASAFMYLTLGLFLIAYMFKKTFRLEYLHPLIIPFAIVIFSFSLMPDNLVTAIELEVGFFRNFAWLTTFVMPILLLFIARTVKGNKKKGGLKE